jgi:hypothetical protein
MLYGEMLQEEHQCHFTKVGALLVFLHRLRD